MNRPLRALASVCAVACFALLAGAAQAAPAPQGMQPGVLPLRTIRTDARPFVSVALGDLRAWASHPKDAGLVRALAMLEGRLADLPVELGDGTPVELRTLLDPQVMPVWMRFLQAPKSMGMGFSMAQLEETGNPMVMGFAMQEADAEAARRYHDQLMALLEGMGAPLPPGLVQVEGRALQVAAGTTAPALGTTGAAALVGGGRLVEEVRLDMGAFFGFIRQAAGSAPTDVMVMLSLMDQLGLSDLRVEAAVASDGEVMRSATVALNMAATMRASGVLPAGGLETRHLAPVPADATFAVVQRIDLSALFEAANGLMSGLMAQQGMGEDVDLGDMVKSTTGVDLREGLFGALGGTVGLYASDTTGGGGLTSTVMFAEIADADTLADTGETITDLINAIAMGPARGYVSFRTTEEAGVEYTTLMFPGLPVPLEPTFALSPGWAILAATPTAARGAMGHALGGGASLATVPEVAAALSGGERTAVSYFDTAHFARIGYGPTSLAMSAVANAVRSPVDASREPGSVMPTFASFREGILPAVGYTEVRGDDLVTISTGDGSFVVGMATVAGVVQEYAAALALPLLAVGAEELGREFGFRF